MSTSLRFFVVLLTVLVMAGTAFGQPTIVNFDFGAVRIACGNGYAYEGAVLSCPYGYNTQNFNASPSFGWILGAIVARQLAPTSLEGGAGLTGPDTIFSPPSFDGMPFNQAVFLQDRGGFVWQAVAGFSPGNYTLSFYLGSRYTSGGYDGDQTVEALIDGNVIGTWALSSYTPFTLRTATFTVKTEGSHALAFMGMNRGDHTAFLSYVVITPVDSER
jgi:hypothetical protein